MKPKDQARIEGKKERIRTRWRNHPQEPPEIAQVERLLRDLDARVKTFHPRSSTIINQLSNFDTLAAELKTLEQEAVIDAQLEELNAELFEENKRRWGI